MPVHARWYYLASAFVSACASRNASCSVATALAVIAVVVQQHHHCRQLLHVACQHHVWQEHQVRSNRFVLHNLSSCATSRLLLLTWVLLRNLSSRPVAKCSVSCWSRNSSATSTIQLTTIMRMPGVKKSPRPAAWLWGSRNRFGGCSCCSTSMWYLHKHAQRVSHQLYSCTGRLHCLHRNSRQLPHPTGHQAHQPSSSPDHGEQV